MTRLLLGHLVGDYLLQSHPMALGKSKPGLAGWAWCLLHCTIYTATVCLFLQVWTPQVFALVFASHVFIDRYSLGALWGRCLGRRPELAQTVFAGGIQALVYVATDNTMHLLLMWAWLSWMGVL